MGAGGRTTRDRDLRTLPVGAGIDLTMLATHDGLTGLANREVLLTTLADALARRQVTGDPAALLFCDVDHFKLVNDTLGHAAGDEVLQGVADRLAAACADFDTVARLGGDEFGVVLTGSAVATAEQLANELVALMREPVKVDGRHLPMSMSVGVAHARDVHMLASDLLRDADAALYEAKTRGRDRVDVFSPAHGARLQRRAHVERDLRNAIACGELLLFYQPIIDLLSGGPVGVEALVRWQHPERGLLAPVDFIDVAEETGLIAMIDRFTLEETCRQLRVWDNDRHSPPMVSVNMSGRDLRDDGVVDLVQTTIGDASVDPSALCIEITESTMLHTGDAAIAALRSLRDFGCYLALDDFGTGYSSLSAVRHLPVEVLKIDRTFIAGLATNAQDAAVVAAVMSLAHALGLHVIAEGVEGPDQARALLDLGCSAAQGFLFSKPLAPEALADVWRASPTARRESYAAPARVTKRSAEPLFIDEFMQQMGIPSAGVQCDS
jgi:diguanylate cyclase (GGDEF)-like protein